jgi:hypothetical protein
MNKPVNTIKINMIKTVSDYNLETGEVNGCIQMYSQFDKLYILPDGENKTIRERVLKTLYKECIEFSTIEKNGSIFEESRLTFQTFEDENGCTEYEETPYFVDNDLYIEINNGYVSMDELKEIFPEVSLY